MNYKDTSATSYLWQRCRSITISNPHPAERNLRDPRPNPPPAAPTATFNEERVVELPNSEFLFTPAGECAKVFDAATTFPLLDPITGAPTGQTFSHGELYVILYSLYLQTATERDAALAANA